MYLAPTIKPQDTFNDYYYSGSWIDTPRAKIDGITNYLIRHTMNNTFTATVTPVKNLTIKSIFSYYYYQRHTYKYTPGTMPTKAVNEGGTAYRAEWDEHSLSTENTVTYAIKPGKHRIDLMAGMSGYDFKSNNFTLEGKGYMDDEVKWNNMNAVPDKLTYTAGSAAVEKVKFSLFARANWNYDSRFYLTGTIRQDGASNFAVNKQIAYFPSGAFKWNIANEPWLKGARWLDELSFRASAGVSGNDAIGAYRSHAALSTTTGGYLFGLKQPVATYRGRQDSPDLVWEKTAAYNAAIDFVGFDGRISLTAETYLSKTSDLLLNVATPHQTGQGSKFVNIGRTSNKGIEFTLSTRNIVKRDFSWTTDFTISHNEQMVEDIGGEQFVSALDSPGNNPYMMYGYVAGYPLNALWGFKFGGIWTSNEERERNQVTNTYVSPSNATGDGRIRYYDINHDGTLSQEDLVYQGNADPWLYGGLQNTFHWKNLRLGVYVNYSLGGKIYNYSEIYMAGSIFTNQYRYMLNAWHPERNPESQIPRAGGKTDAALPSDFMIHDASYVRIKNVSLSYTLPFKRTSFLRDATFSLIGENLYLWKNYNGFDPDVSSEGTSSTLRRVDLGAYPKARTVTFSIQVRY
jgi:TonB-linked SusC/RagA family outer membrane protein